MNSPSISSIVKSAAGALVLATFLLACSINTVNAQETVSFENQVKPFIKKYCLECHEGEDAESFRMDNDEMMDYVVVGDADESELYTRMLEEDEDLVMPPPEFTARPNKQEIMLVKAWINQGAEGPQGALMEDELAAGDVGMVDNDAASPDAAIDKPEAGESKFEKHIYNAVGSLHPAAIHLPIGLLLAAGLFGLLSLRGSFVMSDCAYYCLWLGTWGAIFACVSGWWYSPMEHRGTVVVLNDLFDQNHKVFWHRTGGLIVTIVAFFVAVMAKWTRDSDPEEGIAWKLGAIVVAAGIGWVGHEGGELTYGKKHYKDLDIVVEYLTEEMTGQPPRAAADEDADEGELSPAVDEMPSEVDAVETQTPFNADDI